jgi:hypothetical protein
MVAMLARSPMPLIGSFTLPTWLGEILVSAGVAARTIAVFAAAVAFGILVAIKIGEGSPSIAAAAAVGLLLFVILPVRLWWLISDFCVFITEGPTSIQQTKCIWGSRRDDPTNLHCLDAVISDCSPCRVV